MTRIKIKHHCFFGINNFFLRTFYSHLTNWKWKWKCWWLSHVQLFATHGLYSPRGSSAHEILQAEILEWFAMTFSRGSSWPREQTWIAHIAGRFFTIWTTLFIVAEIVVCTYTLKPIFARAYEKGKSDVCKLWTVACYSESRNHLCVKV